jgi:DMSO/TMAO reductase YedYZ molybdopterin-dependent catalytic subunit
MARDKSDKVTHVGRRTVLGLTGLGVLGVAVGASVQNAVGGALTTVSDGLGSLGALIPGADRFRIYTVTNSIPIISASKYRLVVNGMVERPLSLSLDDLRHDFPRTKLVHTFQCVTGWTVPDVHWEGVHLGPILERAGVRPGASALRLFSGDGVYTESLTLEQAHLPNVMVADKMIGNDVTPEHGGPVRLYVAPMYGYKSIKWLSRIVVTNKVVPGYWEGYGYAVDGWIDGVVER